MSTADLVASTASLQLLALGATLHGLRLRRSGHESYARVEVAGKSLLVGKRAMELGYFCLLPAARACAALGVSANAVTTFELLLGAAAGAAAALGALGVTAVLAALSSLCDALDGMVARETRTASPSGALFDASVDRTTEFLLLGGLALHYRAEVALLGLVLAALLGSFMVSYGSAKAEALGVRVPRGAMRRLERAVYLCGGLLLSPFTGAVSAHGLLPAWVAEAPLVGALGVVAVVSTVSAALRLRAIARATRPAPSAEPGGPASFVLSIAPPASPIAGLLASAVPAPEATHRRAARIS
jgi:CDP-diacylglycerol--glycerol-3-phosphate 3-phosphatidyltransferase